MRKFFSVLCVILCIAALSGCAEKPVWALPDAEQAKIMDERHPQALSLEESFAMSRYMCANRVYIADDALYTLDFDADSQPVLAAYDRKGTELSNFRILASACAPEYLSLYENKLYYVNIWANWYIESLDLESHERKTVVEKPCSFLRIEDGKLWYSNEKDYFCCSDLDGSGETVLLEKRCFYPWVWGDAILYQDQQDGERLHLYWPKDKTDLTLTSGAAYAPLLIGERLYFTEDGRLRSMSIEGKDPRDFDTRPVTGAAEYIVENGSWLARCITDDYHISQWTAALESGSVSEADHKGYRYCDYIGPEGRVDAVYFSDGRLRDFELILSDGQSRRYINKMN